MRIFFGEDQHLPEAGYCPVCRGHLTGVFSTHDKREPDRKPRAGDFTICGYCATVLRFEVGLQYTVATPDDLRELQEEEPDTMTVLIAMQEAARRARTNMRRKKYKGN